MALALAIAQAHLDAWVAADLACASGQSYTIGDRQLTRANLPDIRDQIAFWQRTVDQLTVAAAGGRSTAAVAVWNSSL